MTQVELERSALKALDNRQYEMALVHAILAVASAIVEKVSTPEETPST